MRRHLIGILAGLVSAGPACGGMLAFFDPGCDGVAERRGGACDRAIRSMCQRMGRVGGYGPVEIRPAAFDPSVEELDVVCLARR